MDICEANVNELTEEEKSLFLNLVIQHYTYGANPEYNITDNYRNKIKEICYSQLHPNDNEEIKILKNKLVRKIFL